MLKLSLFIPLIFFLLLYLLLQILKLSLFLIYLFQLKEYRLDRLWQHLKTRTGSRHFFNYLNILKWREACRPKFTLRAIIIFLLTLFIQYNVFFYVLRFSLKTFKNVPVNILFAVGFTVLLLNLLTPFIIILTLGISSLLTWPVKKLAVFLATQKIKSKKNLLVIGVTGSYAKTTVKEILGLTLANFFKTLKTPVNCNTLMGVAGVILTRLRRSHEIFVVEMGAYKKGEIGALCKMVQPRVGIITGINEQHLGLFGTIANTQWAKFELIKSLPENGLAIFNASNYYCQRLYKIPTKAVKKLYGQRKMKIKTKLLGDWQQENVQPLFLVAEYLGIPREKIMASLRKIDHFTWGLVVKTGIKATKVINDSYSANPAGFMAALGMLKKIKCPQKILVTPGIIELGSASEAIHKKIGKRAAVICTKVFLTKYDFEKYLRKGVGKTKDKQFIEVEEDEIMLFEKLKPLLGKETVILLEGRVPSYLIAQLRLQK